MSFRIFTLTVVRIIASDNFLFWRGRYGPELAVSKKRNKNNSRFWEDLL